MTVEKVKLDGREFNVRIKFGSLRRSFEIVEGPNSGVSMSGRTMRDIIGTKYWYSMDVEPHPLYLNDYDDFYEAVSSPVDGHTIELPYGSGGETLMFECYVESGEDTFNGRNGFDRWTGLHVEFYAQKPQRLM